VQVALLGPIEVTADGRAVPVSGARLQRLLLRLAAGATVGERSVSGPELIEAVWGDEPPSDSTNALQTLVSRLRRAMGDPALVQQVSNGYRLAGARTDVQQFGTQVRAAQAAQSAGALADAVELYRQALELWRGPALADAAGAQWSLPLVARWDDERESALLARIDCELRLGRAAVVVSELAELARSFPLREEFTQSLMSALVALGRPADALAAYDRLRRALADELGVDPAPELRAMHQQLLQETDAEVASSRPGRRTNLRASLTSFLGRDDEVKRLSTLLESGRLATLVGPGGAGKTRLAGVAAGLWLDRMADGVWLVELAPVTDEANVPLAILTSLGILADQLLERGVDTARKPTIERLIDALREAECLLVVDNCEHLIAGVAGIVGQLLGSCPAVRVLATSREPLGIDGEALCMIPPLTMPDPDAGPGEAESYPSVQLFADRAAAVSAQFRIDPNTVAPVIEIVRRLDGLPLAIELAAARLRVLPVEEIAARLSDRFRLLTGGSRIAMPRHRTLRAVVEWSWDLLTDGERLLAERLAIFPSGASVDSAQAIAADELLPAEDIVELLSALVDKSLLKLSADPMRYQMLETIREYGIERLAERGELAELRLRHARYFAELAVRNTELLRGPEQLTHLRLLEAERDNVLSALAYLTEANVPEEAVRLAFSLCWYWTMLGRHSEATRWLTLVLQGTQGHRSPRRLMVEAMYELNSAATSFGNAGSEGEGPVQRMAKLYDELGTLDPLLEPTLPLLRSILTFFAGSPERTLGALRPALESEDPWIRGSALMFRANVFENAGDLAGMRVDAQAAFELFSNMGDRWGMASTGSALAQLQVLDGDLSGAILRYRQASEYLAEFGARTDESMLHLRLADLYLRSGDVPAAKDEVRLARDGEFQMGGRAQRLMTDAALASIAVTEGDVATMRRLRDRIAEEVTAIASLSPMNGHVLAVALSTLAILLVKTGDCEQAAETLADAYRAGLGTHDMPIMALVALATAIWAAAVGAAETSAELLGATGRLRGAPDPTEPFGAALARELTEVLGVQRFEEAVARGLALDRDGALERVRAAV
jgi:predicted ATPase/DNA-binding SARP family transcriptional activator